MKDKEKTSMISMEFSLRKINKNIRLSEIQYYNEAINVI